MSFVFLNRTLLTSDTSTEYSITETTLFSSDDRVTSHLPAYGLVEETTTFVIECLVIVKFGTM